VCKGCALGKNIKKAFPSSENRSKGILDLIHSDVCGPMPANSLGGSLYYVTFIDDFSRKTWLYLLKTKDEVFGKFQEFKVEVDNLTDKKIKIRRSDNGGEYTSKELVAFCKEDGIRRELIAFHNPQQNGVVERKNRTIEESVNAMMNDQNLFMFLWGEAVMTTGYSHNRSPHRILKNMTPKEAFSGKKPSVEHLRIFGCPVYIHVTKYKRKKLEPSGKRGIFVGYSKSSKAFRIYVPGRQKVEINRDVTFDERIAFKKSIEDSIDSNEEEEHEDTKEDSTCSPEHPNEEPKPSQEHVELVIEPKTRKRPAWLESTLQEAQRHKAPSGTFRQSKKPKRFSSYAACYPPLLVISRRSCLEAHRS
jgi:hypothetical protein